jgi:hypothetical protein
MLHFTFYVKTINSQVHKQHFLSLPNFSVRALDIVFNKKFRITSIAECTKILENIQKNEVRTMKRSAVTFFNAMSLRKD